MLNIVFAAVFSFIFWYFFGWPIHFFTSFRLEAGLLQAIQWISVVDTFQTDFCIQWGGMRYGGWGSAGIFTGTRLAFQTNFRAQTWLAGNFNTGVWRNCFVICSFRPFGGILFQPCLWDGSSVLLPASLCIYLVVQCEWKMWFDSGPDLAGRDSCMVPEFTCSCSGDRKEVFEGRGKNTRMLSLFV